MADRLLLCRPVNTTKEWYLTNSRDLNEHHRLISTAVSSVRAFGSFSVAVERYKNCDTKGEFAFCSRTNRTTCATRRVGKANGGIDNERVSTSCLISDTGSGIRTFMFFNGDIEIPLPVRLLRRDCRFKLVVHF